MARQFYLLDVGVINSAEGGREWYVQDVGVLNEATSAQTITPTSISSAEAFGAVVIAGPVTVSGIASAEAFGTAAVLTGIAVPSIDSAEAFGTPVLTLSAGVTIYPSGIASSEAVGRPVVVLGVVGTGLILPTGIPSEEAVGIPTLTRGVAMATGWDTVGSLGAGVPFGLLPPQDLEPFPNMMHQGFDTLTFRRWFEKLATRVRQQNQINSTQLQLNTINIADFGTKLHQDLDNVEGSGEAGDAQHWSTQEKLDNVVWRWIAIDT